MSKSITVSAFRASARAALMEVELNVLRDREDTAAQDELWEYFDALEQIAAEAQQPQRAQQAQPAGDEVIEGEVID